MAATGKSWLAAAAAPVRTQPKGAHLLHRTYQFSYVHRSMDRKNEDYKNQIRNIATVGTVEEFWAVYTHLNRVNKLSPNTDYFLFQKGVQPMWEDDANKRGGRLTIRLQKAASPRAFEDLCLALIGEQFETDDICGIACSVRTYENNLSIWLKDANNKQLLVRVESIARRNLNLEPKIVLRDWSFKAHNNTDQSPSS